MKLKFTINYRTQWGETMHISLTYLSRGSAYRTTNLAMTTQDGQLWTVETAAVESRQHPVSAVAYSYQVENEEGEVLRREWSLVGRTFYFDPSKNYTFDDQWRDTPLCAHLYSNAYLTTQHRPHGSVAQARRVPLYRRTALFRVSAPQLEDGQALALLGSHPMMGGWNTARYLLMDPIGQGDWVLTVNMDGVQAPAEYKYVVVDSNSHQLVAWEEGDNRSVGDDIAEGEVRVSYGGLLRLREKTWRAAGVVVPVFALRTDNSFGVGDFGALRQFVDWALLTGMRIIQLLPVNDTTTDGRWHDSYPYNIVSCFALHPHYLDLSQMGELKSRTAMTAYRRRQRELNALAVTDYEAVERVKGDYVADLFAERGQQTLASREYKAWAESNAYWLGPYAAWKASHQRDGRQPTEDEVRYVQYHLHRQLKAAADYARSKGISLKGDVPIGVSPDSVETATHPELFNLDAQTGAPPDAFAHMGQNWGFPTYRWPDPAAAPPHPADEPGGRLTLPQWFYRRLNWMEQYFDAIRIDHVLAFFRTWEIPADAIYGTLGHFVPALPLSAAEIEQAGLVFRQDFLTRPFVNDRVLQRLFGIHAAYVREHYLIPKAYGLYDLKGDYDTQQKVRAHFEGLSDENSLWIRDGLYRLVANVLFVRDPRQADAYHPRIAAYQEPVFDALTGEERDAYMRLYNNYFYQRHSMYWGYGAMHRLGDTVSGTRMLVCAEDLGMLPDCVAPVLDALRVLTLEIQTMPKQGGYEFSHLDGNPYRSVATISTHDMAPLRLWWEEAPERTQRYYATMLQKGGQAPAHLPAHTAEEIIARHLYCPSMLCLLTIQDWLAMDTELRRKHPREERINTPSDPFNRWQYRMHLTIEQLLAADKFNNKIRTMISRSKR